MADGRWRLPAAVVSRCEKGVHVSLDRLDTLSRDVSGTTPPALVARALRRRWWAIVLCILIGVGLATAYTKSRPVFYQSTASLVALPVGVPVDQADRADSVDLDTETRLVTSAAVAAEARTLLKTSTDAATLAANVKVSVIPNTRVITVTYTDATPTKAQQGAHAFAQSYITVRSADAVSALTKKTGALEEEVKALDTKLAAVAKQIASAQSNSTEAVVAESQRTVLINQISTLEGKAGPLRAASTTAGTISDDAKLPLKPAGSAIPLNGGSGALLGLLLGLCLALGIDRLDLRLRDGEDVERRLRLPVLASCPGVRRTKAAIAQPAGEVGQMFSELRNVLVSRPGHDLRVVAVSPASRGAAGGFVAANLVDALVRSEREVLLVAADERSSAWAMLDSRLEDWLLSPSSPEGLPLYRTSRDGLSVCVPKIDFDGGYDWIPAGALRKLADSTDDKGASPDLVVVDAPSTVHHSRTQMITVQGDASVIVVEARRTTSRQVEAAHRRLERMGVQVAGVVVVPRLTGRTGRTGRRFSRKGPTPRQVEAPAAVPASSST